MSEAIEILRQLQMMLEDSGSVGIIGANGPTIDEMIAHTEKTGGCYADDAAAQDYQWTWRKLEKAIKLLEK